MINKLFWSTSRSVLRLQSTCPSKYRNPPNRNQSSFPRGQPDFSILLVEEFLRPLIYLYIQIIPLFTRFLYIHPRWCRISSINSIIWWYSWISSKTWRTSLIATLLNPDQFHIREVLRYIPGAGAIWNLKRSTSSCWTTTILKTETLHSVFPIIMVQWKMGCTSKMSFLFI